jgi:hypothetical protein
MRSLNWIRFSTEIRFLVRSCYDLLPGDLHSGYSLCLVIQKSVILQIRLYSTFFAIPVTTDFPG